MINSLIYYVFYSLDVKEMKEITHKGGNVNE